MNYPREELVDMTYALGAAERNTLLASRIYAQWYPERRHPQTQVFEKLKDRFERTGSVTYEKHERIKPATNDENNMMVALSVVEMPQKSTRQLARELPIGISATSVNRILRSEHFHPYHIQLLHELQPEDYERRLAFCQWAQRHQPDFFNLVLFSDEATFHNNGSVNRHNFHYYDTSNPFFTRETHLQHRWSINVWAGIIGNYVIGPHFFHGHLTGEMYLEFLQNELNELLETLPAHYDQGRIWFQQDGAPAHYSQAVRHYLDNRFRNRWIGRGGPVQWPPRSPDLTKMDFFFWGYVKEKVYQVAPTTRENMQLKIREVFQTITPDMLEKVSDSFLKRIDACARNLGGHIEHSL